MGGNSNCSILVHTWPPLQAFVLQTHLPAGIPLRSLDFVTVGAMGNPWSVQSSLSVGPFWGKNSVKLVEGNNKNTYIQNLSLLF